MMCVSEHDRYDGGGGLPATNGDVVKTKAAGMPLTRQENAYRRCQSLDRAEASIYQVKCQSVTVRPQHAGTIEELQFA